MQTHTICNLLIDFHTHRPTPEGVITPRSFGIHPWQSHLQEVPESDDVCWQGIDIVGECGLDVSKPPSMEIQMECFEKQIIIAEKRHLPMVIHCVRAFDQLIALRQQYKSTPWVVHGFTGGPQQADQLSMHGISVSIGAALLDERRTKIRETLCHLGSENLLLETDDSGASIHQIYATAATLLHISIEQLASDIAVRYNTIIQSV